MCLGFISIVALAACSSNPPILIEPIPIVPEQITVDTREVPLSDELILSNPTRYSQYAKQVYQEGDSSTTIQIVDVLTRPNAFPREIQFILEWLTIQLMLDSGKLPDLTTIAILSPSSASEQAETMLVWSRIYTMQSNHLTAIKLLSNAKRLNDKTQSLSEDYFNQVTWQSLLSLTPSRLENLRDQIAIENLTDWIEAAQRYNASLSDTHWQLQLNRLRDENPESDAARWLTNYSPEPPSDQQTIALLLPQSGQDQLIQAAKAIRNGWMQAHFSNIDKLETYTPPKLEFYDTSLTPVSELVQQAFQEGADYVVGPLSKQHVDEVLEVDHQLPTNRVLLLNHPTPGNEIPPGKVRHVAWSIEDEALLLSRLLVSQSHRKCVLFSGNANWMIRARTMLEVNFTDPDLILSRHQIEDYATVTEVVGEGLGIKESMERRESLQEVIRYEVEFEPRLNEDVNCIVAFVGDLQLQAILESLRYHSSRDIDVFVSESAVRNGLPENSAGMVFPSSPWLIDQYRDPSINNQNNPSMRSFHSLGFDAYRLSTHWESLGSYGTIAGMAGIYQLAEDGTIERLPDLAQVKDQSVVPYQGNDINLDIQPFL